MPKRKFSLQEKAPKRLELSWGFGWKNMVIRLDGSEVGTIANQTDLKAGQEFALSDGSKLSVRLVQILNIFPELEVLLDGKPVPNSGTDPNRLLANSYGSIYFIAGINLAIGMIALIIAAGGAAGATFTFANALGFLLAGLLYLVLGILVWKRFSIALWIAIALYVLDTVLTLGAGPQSAYGSGRLAGILVFRTFLILLMVQGFGAIRSLKSVRYQEPPASF